jgi:hypothetical protein
LAEGTPESLIHALQLLKLMQALSSPLTHLSIIIILIIITIIITTVVTIGIPVIAPPSFPSPLSRTGFLRGELLQLSDTRPELPVLDGELLVVVGELEVPMPQVRDEGLEALGLESDGLEVAEDAVEEREVLVVDAIAQEGDEGGDL